MFFNNVYLDLSLVITLILFYLWLCAKWPILIINLSSLALFIFFLYWAITKKEEAQTYYFACLTVIIPLAVYWILTFREKRSKNSP